MQICIYANMTMQIYAQNIDSHYFPLFFALQWSLFFMVAVEPVAVLISRSSV